MTKFKTFLIIVSLFFTACVVDKNISDTASGKLPYTFAQFSDIPIPEGAVMDLDDTAIFGRKSDWLGKIIFSAPYGVDGIFDFYMNEMSKFGWIEITSVRGASSVLLYVRNNRFAIIQLQSSNFTGTNIIFTISPIPKTYLEKKTVQNLEPRTIVASSDKVVSQNALSTVDTLVGATATASPKSLPNSFETQNPNVEMMPLTKSSLFVSPDAQKAMVGSLNLGDASNANYKSDSKGVGVPPAL